MNKENIAFDQDLMKNKECVLKRRTDSKWLEIPKLIFIIIMFPFFLVYAIFLNKFSRMVLSRIIVLVYFASLFLLAVTLFERVTDPNSKSNKYDKISVEFYDKIKKF